MIHLTKLNKLADIYSRAPLCSLKWILMPAGAKTQQQSTFKLQANYTLKFYKENPRFLSLQNRFLVQYSLMRMYLTDTVTELGKKNLFWLKETSKSIS